MGILDIIIGLLVFFWIAGFALRIGGSLIHMILVIAVIIFIARLLGIRI